jgi:hypothetical protein
MLPTVPVKVSVKVPWVTGLDPEKLTVAIAEPFSATGLGEITQVDPVGLPLHARDALPVSPPCDVSEIA